MTRHLIDGEPATPDRLGQLATFNFGHFTSMQVRAKRVRGLGLHLERLDAASRELFGEPLPGHRVFDAVRQALGDTEDASVRVSVFAEPAGPPLQLLVSVSEPTPHDLNPLSVRTTVYERYLPHLKHVATLPLIDQRRRAQAAGFDDALFLDRQGRVLEGTIWNVGFFDGERVVWPQGPQLLGVTLQLVKQGLAKLGAPQIVRRVSRRDLRGFVAAFTCYSVGAGRLIREIDGAPLSTDQGLSVQIQEAYSQSQPESL